MHTAQAASGESLASEYLRLLLIGTSATFTLYWLLHVATDGAAIELAATGFLVLAGSLYVVKAASRVAVSAILAAAFGLICVLAWRGSISPAMSGLATSGHFPPFSPLAVTIYAASLGLLAAMRLNLMREPIAEVKTSNQGVAGIVAVLVPICAVALLLYMVAWPAVQWIFGWGEFGLPTTMGDRLTLGQEIRIRTAKLSIFLIFVAVGASFGSFLHVVADTLPRGQGVPLRSSACPVCKTPIRRLDNIPIFSYLILRGRCRDCDTEIPVRYLWAELSMALMFAGFFLLELVNGASNLPGFRVVSYTGIVWVILYTKWDIVGIVAFHLFLYATILTALYATWQKHVMPWYYWLGAAVVCFGLPLISFHLLPMKLATLQNSSPVFVNALTSLAGGLVGIAGGAFLAKAFSRRQSARAAYEETELQGLENASLPETSEDTSTSPEDSFRLSLVALVPAMGLLGIGLGWQAILGITACFLVLSLLLSFQRLGRDWFAAGGVLPVLLVAALIHQFTWKLLVKFGQPVWPHQNSHWFVSCGFAMAVLAGLYFVSRYWKSLASSANKLPFPSSLYPPREARTAGRG